MTPSRLPSALPAPDRHRGIDPLDYQTVFGVAAAEPHGATRWRFER